MGDSKIWFVIFVSYLAVSASLGVEHDGDNTAKELLGTETKSVNVDHSISLETTKDVLGDVKTNVVNPTNDFKVSANKNTERTMEEETKDALTAASSITATKENIITEAVKDTIVLTEKNKDKVKTESNSYSSSSSVKSVPPSQKIISASSSVPSIMSSLSETPTLPKASTTIASSSLIVTTNSMEDDELDRWNEVEPTNALFKEYDFRAKFPQTVYEGINPTKTLERMERTVPSYPRKSPNMIGLDDDLPDNYILHQY